MEVIAGGTMWMPDGVWRVATRGARGDTLLIALLQSPSHSPSPSIPPQGREGLPHFPLLFHIHLSYQHSAQGARDDPFCIDFILFFDAIASPSTYPCRSVSQSVSQWVMFSDFGDSYCIYRACELVKMSLKESQIEP